MTQDVRATSLFAPDALNATRPARFLNRASQVRILPGAPQTVVLGPIGPRTRPRSVPERREGGGAFGTFGPARRAPAGPILVGVIDEGLELLDEDMAWKLLRGGDVGRVGFTMGALPAIFPVNYAVIDDAIVFRTAPGSKLSAATDSAVVAFEVDDYDRTYRSSWSVLAIGRSEVVHGLAFTRLVLDAGLEPFAGGRRSNLVRIQPELLTGRRIIHDDEGD